MAFSITEILGFIIIYQSLFFLGKLLLNKNTKPLFVKMLGLICVLIAIHFGLMVLESHTNKQYLLGPFFGLIYGPIFYVFAKSLILENTKTRKLLTHFIPAVLSLILLSFFNEDLMSYITIIGLIVTAHFIGYLLSTLRLIFKYRKMLKTTASSFRYKNLRWLEIIIYIQMIALLMTVFESSFESTYTKRMAIFIIYLLALILIHCFYFLGLKHANTFRGFEEGKMTKKIGKEYSISEELFKEYVYKLKAYMNKEKPYLEFDLSLQDLSEALSISQRNVSHIINSEFHKNFYDYINSFRLEISKQELLGTEKAIKEIMYDSGFSNKATFNSIFKKATSLTPTEFRTQYKK
tara:strand:+ start:83441 stop:84490 length:1050 start_codon:yes stop_codon:yes gene_type:complete